MTIKLKNPVASYQPRLTRFLQKMDEIKQIPPRDQHLWRVMDTVAFQDTETRAGNSFVQ